MTWIDAEPFLVSYSMLLGPTSSTMSENAFLQASYARSAAEEIVRIARQHPDTNIFYLLENYIRKMEKTACNKYGTFTGLYCSVAHDIGEDILDGLMLKGEK